MSKFKKVAIVAKNPGKIIDLKKELSDFEYDEAKPDFVLSVGGDGTYLFAERKYPGIPKLLIKDSDTCVKCHDGEVYHLISKILRGEYVIEEHVKLEAEVADKKWICANNFVIRNKVATHALRFYLRVDGKQVNDIILGDGIVVSTPFGSTAYHYSITRKPFDKGIGVAFSNATKPIEHIIAGEDAEIECEIVRGDACFVSDNDPEVVELIERQVVKIRKANESAKLIKIEH